jgi:ABC-type transport system involved in cytochrome c biogenesis permease subunit
MALLAAYSYLFLFIRFAVTRDFPWANLLLFLIAGGLLAVGLYRAFAQPDKYRGRVSGTILAALSLGILGLFCYGVFWGARHLPPGENALRVGQPAPDFGLADVDGRTVSLSQLREGKRAVLLIFYRGYW